MLFSCAEQSQVDSYRGGEMSLKDEAVQKLRAIANLSLATDVTADTVKDAATLLGGVGNLSPDAELDRALLVARQRLASFLGKPKVMDDADLKGALHEALDKGQAAWKRWQQLRRNQVRRKAKAQEQPTAT